MPLTKDQFLDACSYLTQTGALSGVLFIDGNNQVVLDEGNANADITPDEATLTQALSDLSTQQATETQNETNATLTKSQIRDYLRAQLVNPSPNLATIKTTIETAISGNADVQQAITNIAALFGFDDTTAAGYVRCALLAVPVLIE